MTSASNGIHTTHMCENDYIIQCPACKERFTREDLVHDHDGCPKCGCTDQPITLGMDKKRLRCTDCRAELSYNDLQVGGNCCPKCGSVSVPMNLWDDVEIKINVHELRILSIWAFNYARKVDDESADDPNHPSARRTIKAILASIHPQLEAVGRDRPLTLEEELQELRNFPGIEGAEMYCDGKMVTTTDEEDAAAAVLPPDDED